MERPRPQERPGKTCMTPRKVIKSEGRSVKGGKDFAQMIKSNGLEGLMRI